ncbi:MAG: hypothetical protein WBB28_05150 [Crinalium sp.]
MTSLKPHLSVERKYAYRHSFRRKSKTKAFYVQAAFHPDRE